MDILPLLIANAAPSQPDFMVSGNWIIGMMIAIIPVLGGVWIKAKQAGRTEATDSNITLKKPVPTIQTREEQRYVAREEFSSRMAGLEETTEKIWEQFKTERLIWNREIEILNQRMGAQTQATAELQGTVHEVNKTVGQLLAIALNRKPTSR